jgi:hypothetical protein
MKGWVATHTIKVETDHKFYDAYGVCTTPSIYAHSSFHALDRMGGWVLVYCYKKTFQIIVQLEILWAKGMNSLSQVSLLGGEKKLFKMGFFSDPQNALYNSWNSQLDLQHLLPPPPHSFHSSSDMRVNFPSSSDSMQIWKLVSPLHDLLGSLVSITFWAVLIDIGLWRILYPLFVCLSLLVAGGWGGVRGIEIDCTSVL